MKFFTSYQYNISHIRSYLFGFNGKEKLNEQYGEGNAYDFGARIYDPRISRWLARDPLEDTYPSWSTYNFSLNSPLRFNDPTGKGPTKRYAYDFATGQLTELSDEGGDEIDFIEFHNVPQEYIDEYNENNGTNYTNTSFEVSISVDTRNVTVAAYPFDDMDDGYYGGERGPGYLIDYGIGEQPLELAMNDPTYFMPQTYSWRALWTMGGKKMLENLGATKTSSKNTPKTYQTYTKYNSKTKETYSGKTSGTKSPVENVAKRDKNHHKDDDGFGPAKLDKSSSSSDAIRGREQQMIDKNGGAKSQGGTSGNARNSVSPNNPNKAKYEKAAKKEFGK